MFDYNTQFIDQSSNESVQVLYSSSVGVGIYFVDDVEQARIENGDPEITFV
jgi:hypothetical protein